jgi:hypothetical protein
MKNYIFCLIALTSLAMIFGCQKEFNPSNSVGDSAFQETMSFLDLRNYDKDGQSFHYALQYYSPEAKSHTGFVMATLVKLNRSRYDVEWRELYESYQNFLKQHPELDPLAFDPVQSHQLQLIAYELGHRSALSSPASKERNEVIKLCMDILVAQRGVDCDAMAELALTLKPLVSDEEFAAYRQYILNTSEQEFKAAKQALENLKQSLENDQVDESDQYYFMARAKRKYNRLLGAEKAVSLLASSNSK